MLRLAIITGLSGSGKSTATKCFEDMGYFTIDNLPVPLVDDFLHLTSQSREGIQKIAMVMDARIGNTINLLPQTVENLRRQQHQVDLIYLEAAEEVLSRRYSETRRKHPLSPDDSPAVGIAKEQAILKEIREISDLVIDTSDYNIHQLKDRLSQTFLGKSGSRKKMAVRITSFGFRYGLPRDADLVFDVRFLPNPFFRNEFRHLTGLDNKVQEYIFTSETAGSFRDKLLDIVQYLVPLYLEEGKAYLHIAIGCTGGKHRSVAIAHWLAEKMKPQVGTLKIEDRDIDSN